MPGGSFVSDGDSLFVALLCAAIACVLVILIDGWFFRPRRDPGAISAEEPIVPRLAGYALVALALGMLWRLFRYEAVDFSFMLVLVGAISGAIWGLDRAFFAGRRGQAAAAAGTPPDRVREPIAVEYARSFFPVILLVLVIRSFLFEPFRIPSDSMMPTLFDGDFIFVSKYSYGLRLPVSNTLVIPTGTPQRGDVIVFRLPPNPKINYIKRLVGLPGDRIRVDEKNRLFVNDVLQPQTPGPIYTGPKQNAWNYAGVPTAWEQLGAKRHQIMFARGSVTRRGNGWCRRGTTSSWATTAITAKTVAGRTIRTRRGSSRSKIWWVRRCGFGLILILVTDLSGIGSVMRFNKGPQ